MSSRVATAIPYPAEMNKTGRTPPRRPEPPGRPRPNAGSRPRPRRFADSSLTHPFSFFECGPQRGAVSQLARCGTLDPHSDFERTASGARERPHSHAGLVGMVRKKKRGERFPHGRCSRSHAGRTGCSQACSPTCRGAVSATSSGQRSSCQHSSPGDSPSRLRLEP